MDDSDEARARADLQSTDVAKRLSAAFLLTGGQISRESVLALRAALQDGEPEVRNQAATALADSGDKASFDAIRSLLEESPPSEATGLAWALAALAVPAGRTEEAERCLARVRSRARGRAREHASALLRNLGSSSE